MCVEVGVQLRLGLKQAIERVAHQFGAVEAELGGGASLDIAQAAVGAPAMELARDGQG